MQDLHAFGLIGVKIQLCERFLVRFYVRCACLANIPIFQETAPMSGYVNGSHVIVSE